MSFSWDVRPTQAWPALSDWYIAAIRRGVYQIARRRAPEIEAWMKDNAPWTDRTGNARQTLTAEAEEVSLDMVSIILAHGMDYGIWLELAHGGAWAIIGPALDHWGPIIWGDVVALFR